MDCEHYNYDPVEHDYCPDCGLEDSELLHAQKEVVELRSENERLQLELAKERNALSGKSAYWYVAEVERLKEENERLRKLLKQSLRHVEQEGDDTLAAIIDTQVNTDASR